MIDTGAIRIKAVAMAVLGELTVDYISNSKADEDLRNMKIVPKRIDSEEIPFELKAGWQWVRMADLGADEKNSFADGPFGSNLKREHYTTEKQVRIIQLSNIGDLGWKDDNEKYTTYEHLETIKRSEVQPGNIVIAKMMPAGRAIIVPDISSKFVLSSDCIKFVPNSGLNVKYLCYAINSQLFRNQVLQGVHGIGRERTSLSKIKTFLLPIPPVDEQKEIANKLDAIFDLLNIIDALQSQYRNNLESLKSKIIDAGIRGKLTEQLPTDGTAEELYAQIQEEKRTLKESGVLKGRRQKKEGILKNESIPFSIPPTWKWITLGNVAEIFGRIGFRGYKKSDIVAKGNGAITISPSNIFSNGKTNFENCTYLSWEKYQESPEIMIEEEDIIIVKTGSSYGKCGIVKNLPEKATINPQIAVLKYVLCNRRFLNYVLNSSMAKAQFDVFVVGAAVPTFSQENLANLIVPLPPHAEQKRIADKIDEILQIIQ